MLLSIPAEILIIIFIIAILFGVIFLIFFGLYNARQKEEVRKEPERIKKKSDAPELPSEGQEDKPIDETIEEVEKKD